jgi:hypothetical protein
MNPDFKRPDFCLSVALEAYDTNYDMLDCNIRIQSLLPYLEAVEESPERAPWYRHKYAGGQIQVCAA